ncbi:hypothetical protein FF011L_36080 [Roseimaritima multifibrata]|uniref:PKD domain-containing protein n=1 Tax=Roseimaritima multifibrata TaxID=1930274 RepID=A0A517MIW1_9BACT|nr:PKD domain-containing protein [Roseimaritima multifibrata]QDS94826.1 hypothetical protein FF011L_36080 [Roseimaritima multifibrata]
MFPKRSAPRVPASSRGQTARRRLAAALRPRRRLIRIEQLEDRRLLAVGTPVLGTSNDILFSGDATNDLMFFSVSEAGLLQHNRGGYFGFTSNSDLDSVTAGEQTRLVSELTSFRYEDAGSNDRLFFDGENPFSLGDAGIYASAGEITVRDDTSIESTGGVIQFVAAQKILLDQRSSLTTVDGGILLSGNPNADAIGDSIGLESVGATIRTSGSGNIQLVGFGGNDPAEYRNYGISLEEGTTIESTSETSSAGTIQIEGTGGDSSTAAYGVNIDGADIVVRSAYGDISIVGVGGHRSSASGSNFYGVNISAADVIESTGTGPDAATITIDGTGGAESRNNYGVRLAGATTDILSIDGDILIIGQGNGDGTGDTNYGVRSDSIGSIASTGTGIDAASITIIGEGGDGTRSGVGLSLNGSTTQLTSVYGDISIVGRGSDGSGYGNSGGSIGLTIASTGLGENAAKIDIQGTGGINTSGSGITVSGSITTTDGDVTITGLGTGDGTRSGDGGVNVTASIDAVGEADIIIDGTGGQGTGANHGVTISSGAALTTKDGEILITGQGSNGAGSNNYGVHIANIEGIESKWLSDGTIPSPAKITIDGTGGDTGGGNHGVYFDGASEGITSVDGAILITGRTGTGTGPSNVGVRMRDFGAIQSTGTTAHAATITIHGEGGFGQSNNYGVLIDSINRSSVSSFVGDILITGIGGTGDPDVSQSSNRGLVLSNVEIASLGTPDNATGTPATITINGTGGIADRQNYGTYINASAVKSVIGNIDIRGEGGGAGTGDTGVVISSTELVSSGEGDQAATITIHSESGVSGASLTLSTIDGDVSFTGLNGSSAYGTGVLTSTGDGMIRFDGGTVNAGSITSETSDIVLRGGAITVGTVESTGTGETAAKILIGDASTHSIQVNGDLTSVDGDIRIVNQITDPSTGVGSILLRGNITSTGINANHAASITIDGTGAENQVGVWFSGAGKSITSKVGDIEITGRGGASATGSSLHGVFLDRDVSISSTGTDTDAAQIDIHGTGGAGVNSNHGVYFRGDEEGSITSVVGAISITGTGGAGTGKSSAGVSIEEASISSTGISSASPAIDAATITITGIGGSGTSGNDGVYVGTDTAISSIDGAISIDGTGGDVGSGVILQYQSSLTSSGVGSDAASITVNGTAGLGAYGRGVSMSRNMVNSVDGDVTVEGYGSAGRSLGVYIDGSQVASTGTGVHAAEISILGIGGEEGSYDNYGVTVRRSTTSFTTIDGDLTIFGQGGSSGSTIGLRVETFDTIASTGTGPNAAKISLTGVLPDGTSGTAMTFAYGGRNLITSVEGDIALTVNANGSNGLFGPSGLVQIESTGVGADAAEISIESLGGEGGSISLSEGSRIDTVDGNIALNSARSIYVHGSISSTGTGIHAGQIRIDDSRAVSVSGSITSIDGDISVSSIKGDAPLSTGYVLMQGSIASTGVGTSAATITIEGQTKASMTSGVRIHGEVYSTDGDIQILGTGSGQYRSGVEVAYGGSVKSLGSDKAHAATITIDGSSGTEGGLGIQLLGETVDSSIVSTIAGDIRIIGDGGNGPQHANRGVWIRKGFVQSTGAASDNAGNITIEGSGGDGGTYDLVGVDISTDAKIVTVAGDIEIIAEAGVGSGSNNDGLRLGGVSLIGDASTAGDITIQADSIDLQSGTVQSTGLLTIAPGQAGTPIGIGGGAGDLNLSDAELALLVDGFNSITIGDATAGIIDIDTATFTDNVSLIGSAFHDHAGTDIDMGANTLSLIGTIAPGQSPGILRLAGAIEFADATVLDLEIDGPDADETANGHDQVSVTGTLIIGAGVTLQTATTNGFDPLLGQQLVIVENDETDPIEGEFAGLPEGSILTNFLGVPLDARISYLGLDGATGNDVVLTIIAGNLAPTADAGGPYFIDEGDSLTLDASLSSAPDDDPLDYTWDLNGDGDFSDAVGMTPMIPWSELDALGIGNVAQFTATVSVDDGRAAAVTATTTVNVQLNAPPIANAGESYEVGEGGSIQLNANGSTDDKGIENLTITWDLDGDGLFGETGIDAERGDETGAQPTFSATDVDGTKNVSVTVRVEDDRGKVDSDTTTVSVQNIAPTLILDSEVTIVRGDSITVEGSFVDPGPDTWTVTVDYADGTGQETLDLDGKKFDLDHEYNVAGTYLVVVTVDDGDGGVSSQNLKVIVNLPPLPDLTLISSDIRYLPINPAVGDPVNFVVDVTNAGSLAATDVPVRFMVYDAVSESFVEIGHTVIDSIDASPDSEGETSQSEVLFTWDGSAGQPPLPQEDVFLLVRVEVDAGSEIEELDESNNEDIQILQVGSPDFGTAAITANISDKTVYRNELVAVGGQAYYDFSTVPGDFDFPIQGASVTMRLLDPASGLVLAASTVLTASNGNFLHTIRSPELDGDYTLRFEVTEGTLSTVFESTLTVLGDSPEEPPSPPRSPPSRGYVFFPSIQFTQSVIPPGNPQIGEPVTIVGTFNYELAQPLLNVPVTFNDLFPVAGEVRTFEIGSGFVNFPDGGLEDPTLLPMDWTPTAEGFHIIQVIAEPDFNFRAHTHVTQLLLVGDLDTSSLTLAYELPTVVELPQLRAGARMFPIFAAAQAPQTPSPGDTVTYTIRYENTGDTTITGGQLIDDFDETVVGVPTNISDGGVVDGSVVRWELGDIPAGASGTVSYEVTINEAAELPPGSAFVFNTAVLNTDQAAAASTSELLLSNDSPVITNLNIEPMVAENGNVTLAGTFSDASLEDTHTIQITWGDGQTDTLLFTAGERAFSLPHSYDLTATPYVESYEIAVTLTDSSGQNSNGSVTTQTPVVAPPVPDEQSPNSSVASAVWNTETNLFDLLVDFADPPGGADAPVSGVQHLEVFYRVNPQNGNSAVQRFGDITLSPASPAGSQLLSRTIDAQPGDIIQVWSVATDGSGNVENEVTPRTDYSFAVADTVGPDTQVLSAIFDGNAFIDLHVSGVDVGGGHVDSIDVYVETRTGTASPIVSLIGTIPGGAAMVDETIKFAVPQDGVIRPYRFFSIGTDHLGNREGGNSLLDGDPGPEGDVLLSDIVLEEPSAAVVTGFDVNNGLENRSSVHSADILFNDENFIDQLLESLNDEDSSNDRIRIERLDLNGNSIEPPVYLPVTAVQDGLTLRLQFGATGIQENGVYAIRLDMDDDADNEWDDELQFHRLKGDINGDGAVDTSDLLKARLAYRNSALHADADVDGNGMVDAFDLRFFSTFLRQRDGEKVLGMPREELDD